ncbi:MAG: Tim44 domain-containing protein [Comamonadaceae bacterium]|nr:MAG: Tim44 domain-containing protein [Comamonadaceae bacterium]
MKKTLGLMAVVLALGLGLGVDAEARRLGGAKSGGMQRQNVTTPAQTPGTTGTPAQAAPVAGAPAAGAAAAGTAAAAGKRSWMGPIAGLAAGLGLAALASHLGFGEAFANMMLIGLAVMAVLLVVGFVMRKQAAARMPAMAGAGAGGGMARSGSPAPGGGSLIGSRIGSSLGAPAAATAAAGTIPAGFDTAAFERNASAQFMALQDANDAGDLARLRGYLTPEMFELVAADIAERGGATQKTEVFGLQARVLEVVEEPAQYVVSVRFTGSVREQPGAMPEDLNEVWHLAKPRFGEGGWVIAGIQQVGAAG